MMRRLPAVNAKELAGILKKLGFAPLRQRGSHVFFRHPDGRTTVIPFHAGRDIGRGLLRSILADIKLTPKDLQNLL